MNRGALPQIMGLLVAFLVVAGSAASGGELGGEKIKEKLTTLPIEITAEELVAERSKERVVFKGNVIAKQDNLTIFADELVAQYGDGGKEVEKIEARGNVKVVQGNVREATGDRAVFLNREQRVELEGSAMVKEGESTLMGDRITIYLVENRSVIQGGEEGRVKAIINPEKFMKKGGKEKER